MEELDLRRQMRCAEQCQSQYPWTVRASRKEGAGSSRIFGRVRGRGTPGWSCAGTIHGPESVHLPEKTVESASPV